MRIWNSHFRAITTFSALWSLQSLMSAASAACLVDPSSIQSRPTGLPIAITVADEDVQTFLEIGYLKAVCPTDMTLTNRAMQQFCSGTGTTPVQARPASLEVARRREALCKSAKKSLEGAK